MQYTAVFQEQLSLTPNDMKREVKSIDEELEKKFASKIENKCSQNGYVLPGTLKILSRSMGYVEKGRFTGNIIFHVQAEASVLNPPDGTLLEGDVMRKNKMGIYVNYNDAIRIILPRDLHIGNEEFESVQINDTVRVEIKKSRFQVNDPYILCVGILRERVKAGVPMVVPATEVDTAAAPIQEVEGEEEATEEEFEMEGADFEEEEGAPEE
jgi:DNA-directed RNA polymerase subunit E'/Rpb7